MCLDRELRLPVCKTTGRSRAAAVRLSVGAFGVFDPHLDALG